MIISGCVSDNVPNIIHIGDCERGIASTNNITDVQKIWPEAQLSDVLISGGCYQDKIIKRK